METINDLPVLIITSLKMGGVDSDEKLISYTKGDLLKFRGMTTKRIQRIELYLFKKGLQLPLEREISQYAFESAVRTIEAFRNQQIKKRDAAIALIDQSNEARCKADVSVLELLIEVNRTEIEITNIVVAQASSSYLRIGVRAKVKSIRTPTCSNL